MLLFLFLAVASAAPIHIRNGAILALGAPLASGFIQPSFIPRAFVARPTAKQSKGFENVESGNEDEDDAGAAASAEREARFQQELSSWTLWLDSWEKSKDTDRAEQQEFERLLDEEYAKYTSEQKKQFLLHPKDILMRDVTSPEAMESPESADEIFDEIESAVEQFYRHNRKMISMSKQAFMKNVWEGVD
ncbi:MAG: hypothetical protein SGCHY_003902, partial [Lobulomycetales sp.]